MTRLSVAVMAHPSRAAMVDELLERLDRPAEVVWDEHSDEWDTGRRSWLAHDPTATHHLVIQDDAIVCRDLVAGIEAMLDTSPAAAQSAMSLYFGALTPFPHQTSHVARHADHVGASWLSVDGMHWGVAMVLPVALIGDMLQSDQSSPRYDKRISIWLDRRRLTTWYPWPSLVDHRDTSSTLPGHGRRPGRVAHRFVGADASALDLDASGPVLSVHSLRSYSARPKDPRGSKQGARHMRVKPKTNYATSTELVTPKGVNTRTLRLPDARHRLVPGVTVAHVDSAIVRHKPELWVPLTIHYPIGDDAGEPVVTTPAGPSTAPRTPPAHPGATQPGPTGPPIAADSEPPAVDGPKPSAKEVRSWVKGQGIDVPARGPLSDEVVDAYMAAHQRTEW